MPSEGLEVRVSFQKLLIGLAITLIPTSIAGLYSLSQSDKALEKTIGNQFRTTAEGTAAAVAQFIHDRVVDVGQIAVDPAIVDAVVASNRSYRGMSGDAIRTKFQKMDAAWPTPAAVPIVQQILSSPASRLLRKHHELDRRILRITVADEKGATVAASHKTVDYYQADEEHWQKIYAQGRGAVSLTDILYDQATDYNYIGVGVPVMEEGSNRAIGTVDALVDVTTLFLLVNRSQMGPTGRTLLLKNDGTVISAPRINLSMKVKSQEFTAVQDSVRTLTGQQTGYVVADLSGAGRTVIGFADTGLKQDYQNLGWIVLVCQSSQEAFAPAPVRFAGRLIAFMSMLSLAMVTLLAVYFFLHRKRSLADLGEVSPELATLNVSAATKPAQSQFEPKI